MMRPSVTTAGPPNMSSAGVKRWLFEWKTKAFAANIDQLLVVVAAEPVFSESQLSRALIAAADAQVATRIVLNKRDLPAFAAARERLQPYVAMGVDVLELALSHVQPAEHRPVGTRPQLNYHPAAFGPWPQRIGQHRTAA